MFVNFDFHENGKKAKVWVPTPNHMRTCVGLWNSSTHGQSVRNYDYPLCDGVVVFHNSFTCLLCLWEQFSLVPMASILESAWQVLFSRACHKIFSPSCIFGFEYLWIRWMDLCITHILICSSLLVSGWVLKALFVFCVFFFMELSSP